MEKITKQMFYNRFCDPLYSKDQQKLVDEITYLSWALCERENQKECMEIIQKRKEKIKELEKLLY